MIEEDKKEEDLQPIYVRQSRYSAIRDRNEFGYGGKRYRSEEDLSRRRGSNHSHRERHENRINPKILALPSNYVSETEEEQSESSGDEKGKRKKRTVMSLGHLSKLLNKMIYSDDFERDSAGEQRRKNAQPKFTTKSMADQPINEDLELENSEKSVYLSDSSSNSQFSLQRRYLNLDLAKLVDRLEPIDDISNANFSKYSRLVDDTIEEENYEQDDETERRRASLSSFRGDAAWSFLSFARVNIKAKSSICQLESEIIAEELEEYDYNTNFDAYESSYHCFRVPSRLRTNSEDTDNISKNNSASAGNTNSN